MEGTDQMPKHRARIVEVVKVPETEDTGVFVKMTLMIDANVKITGAHSGRNYVFSGAGSVEDVDERDVEWLLERRQGRRQCCGGGGGGNVVFTLAGE